ncbi:MAG: SRPBCC family protein [Blastocatellia bacterium]
MKTDWSHFTKRITIDATTRAIYNAWAIPEQIESWFLSRADYTAPDGSVKSKTERVKADDAYTWRWHGFANGSPETGKIIEANGHNTFSFTFADNCIVEVTVLPERGEKVVQLTQKKIGPDELLRLFIGCGEGWTFYLANLKSILEGGIDLRNKNDKISGVINS